MEEECSKSEQIMEEKYMEALAILDATEKKYLEALEKSTLSLNGTSEKIKDIEEEPMNENEIIHEISMITIDIIRCRIEIRNLEKQLHKLEDLLEIT